MSNLLINEYPLIVLPTLACYIGLNEALVLQQVHYWMHNSKTGKEVNGKKWIYNTIEQWQESNFPFWTTGVIKRAIKNLENDGLLLSCKNLNKESFDRTKWYTVDYDKLNELLGPVPRLKKLSETRKKARSLRNDKSCQTPVKSTKQTDARVQNNTKQKVTLYQTIPETTTKTTTDTHAPPQKKSKQPEAVTDTNECVFSFYQSLRYLTSLGWKIKTVGTNSLSSNKKDKTIALEKNNELFTLHEPRFTNDIVNLGYLFPPSVIIDNELVLSQEDTCPHSQSLKTDKDIVEDDHCAICGEPMNNVITTNECVFDESFKYQLLRYLLANGWEINHTSVEVDGTHTYVECKRDDQRVLKCPPSITEEEHRNIRESLKTNGLGQQFLIVPQGELEVSRCWSVADIHWGRPKQITISTIEDISKITNVRVEIIIKECLKMDKSCPHSKALKIPRREGITEQDHCVICGELMDDMLQEDSKREITFNKLLQYIQSQTLCKISAVTKDFIEVDTGFHKTGLSRDILVGLSDKDVIKELNRTRILDINRWYPCTVEKTIGMIISEIVSKEDTCPHVPDNLLIDGACPICQETTSGVPITNGLFGFFQFVRHLLNKGYVFDQVNAKNEVVLTTDYKGPPKFHVFTLTQGVNWDIQGEVRIIRDTSLKIYSSNVRVYYEDTCPHVPDSLLVEGNCPICQETITKYPKRIRLMRHIKGWKKPPDAIVVTRQSKKWGNRYKVGDPEPTHGNPMSVNEALFWFVSDFNPAINSQALGRVKEIQTELGGKDLACYCKLNDPCHADVLIRLANDNIPDELTLRRILEELLNQYNPQITFNQLLQFVKGRQRYADTSQLEQTYRDELQHITLDNLPNYTLQLHVKEYYDELQDNDPTLRKYNITTEEIQFNEDIVKEILRMPDVCPHPSDMLNLHSGNCDKCGEWRVKAVNKEEDDFERLFPREKPNGDKQKYVSPRERSEEEKDELLLSAGRGTGFEEVDAALREIDGSTWRIANERIKRGVAAFMGATGWAVPLTKTMRGQWLSTTKTNLEYGDPIELYKKYKDIVDEAKGNGSTWINGIKSPGSLTGKLEAMRQPEIVNGDKNVMMPEKPNPNIIW
jgi:hypothetical protein